MSDQDIDKNLMADHDYDGIQELDNPLPRWWLITFYATMVFSAFYVPYYHFFGGLNPRAEYEVAVEELEKVKPHEKPAHEGLLAAVKDPQTIARGQIVFTSKCIACHGDKGQGVIGPNLTDDYWIHGDGTPGTIAETIEDGVPAKGMPPWGPVLSPEELTGVVAFVVSIRGSEPPNPKAPQGEKKTASTQ